MSRKYRSKLLGVPAKMGAPCAPRRGTRPGVAITGAVVVERRGLLVLGVMFDDCSGPRGALCSSSGASLGILLAN